MSPSNEKSQLKRGLPTADDTESDYKKPRRSQQGSDSKVLPGDKDSQLPSPVTHEASTPVEEWHEGTATPPEGRPSQIQHHQQQTPAASPSSQHFLPPVEDTQVLSQFPCPSQQYIREADEEEPEGVWGYLTPLDPSLGKTLVLKERNACPKRSASALANPGLDENKDKGKGNAKGVNSRGALEAPKAAEERYESEKVDKSPAGGYLIGRHPECDRIVELGTVSNRHCLLFSENRRGRRVAMIEDLSSNGTFVNEAIIGRNKRIQLQDGDKITILNEARFTFRSPQQRGGRSFFQQYNLLRRLGEGHYATVHLCAEKATGSNFAVKVFSKRAGVDESSKKEGLQQEIAMLRSVSHPNMLCLIDSFEEDNGYYLVLELAPAGELFEWLGRKTKMTEEETRRVFIQLFQGVKYLHDRGIVHRDIKPENILLMDEGLTIKLADFGLAKIIGEQSFTTTMCGTPGYVAPEILQESNHRKYTRAVDVWSLGVVLYVCLCGFQPFSEELYHPQRYPLTMRQQIQKGVFFYPSPYWEDIDMRVLPLIDQMLTVNPDDRITIAECLEHPWLTQRVPGPGDSTDGLTGEMNKMDFSKRKLPRERTLLSSINKIQLTRVIATGAGKPAVKIYAKNAVQRSQETSETGAVRGDSTAVDELSDDLSFRDDSGSIDT